MQRRGVGWTRLLGVSMAVIVLGLAHPVIPPAGAVQAVSGACVMTLRANWSGNSITLSTPEPGLCVIDTGDTATATFDATVSAGDLSFTCAQAVGSARSGVFMVETQEFGTIGWTEVEVQMAKAGDAIQLAFHEFGNSAFMVGVGELVQVPSSALVCSQGTNPVDWTGVLVFEDPVLE